MVVKKKLLLIVLTNVIHVMELVLKMVKIQRAPIVKEQE